MVPAIPGVAVIVVEAPAQITELLTVTVGNGLTVTVTWSAPTQPFISVPVTVYVVFIVGVAITDAPTVVFKVGDAVHV